MAELTKEQKVLAVELLGAFKDPTKVGKLIQEEFGLAEAPTTSQLARYNVAKNATKPGGDPLSDELKAIFWAARKRAQTDIENIAIVHLSWRAEQYTELYAMALKSKNIMGALAILKQAAQDKGGIFTQRQNGATPQQVDQYVDYLTSRFLEQVKKHVKDPEQKGNLVAGIKSELAVLRSGHEPETAGGSRAGSESGSEDS